MKKITGVANPSSVILLRFMQSNALYYRARMFVKSVLFTALLDIYFYL